MKKRIRVSITYLSGNNEVLTVLFTRRSPKTPFFAGIDLDFRMKSAAANQLKALDVAGGAVYQRAREWARRSGKVLLKYRCDIKTSQFVLSTNYGGFMSPTDKASSSKDLIDVRSLRDRIYG